MRRRSFLRSTAQASLLGGVVAGSDAIGRRTVGSATAPAVDSSTTTGTATGTAENGIVPFANPVVDGIREVVTTEDGRTAFAAVDDGFASIDLTDPAAPAVVARVDPALADHERGPMENVWDVKYDDGRLLVGGPGNHGSAFHGLALYDVSDPAVPELLGTHETVDTVHNCYLEGDFAYHVDEVLGIVDVGGDEFEAVATWELTDHDDAWAEVDRHLRNLHDVWVNGDRAYLAYWDAGCVVLDVSDPANPSFVGRAGERSLADLQDLTNEGFMALPGNAHYVETDPAGDLLAVGEEAGSGFRNAGGIDLWDVSDERDPTQLVTIEPPGETRNADGDALWTTAHNFHLLADVLYTSWYAGGVRVFDVSDPAEPREYAHWKEPADGFFWTARLAVPGEFFVAGSHANGSIDGSQERLFVFPDPRDREPEPVRTSTPTPRPTPTATPTAPTPETSTGTTSGTPTGTTPGALSETTSGTPTSPARETSFETRTAPDAPTATATDAGASTGEPTSSDGPGFGVLAGLGALGVGAWRFVDADDDE